MAENNTIIVRHTLMSAVVSKSKRIDRDAIAFTLTSKNNKKTL